MFGVKIGGKLNEFDFDFIECAKNNFPAPATDEIGDKTKRLCRISLESDFPVADDGRLKCYVAKSSLFFFNVEELWLDKSNGFGVHLVHDFLTSGDLDEFKTFRDEVSFHHMAKFYDDILNDDLDTGVEASRGWW